MLRMRETFASLSAAAPPTRRDWRVARRARTAGGAAGGEGGADVAAGDAAGRAGAARGADSKVGIGQAEETVARSTMRSELRSVETQLAATASLLTATASTTAAWAPPAGRTISPEMKRSAG